MRARSRPSILALLIVVGAGTPAYAAEAAPPADRSVAIRRLRADAASERIVTRDDGTISLFQGFVPVSRFSRARANEARAADFLKAYGAAFGLTHGYAHLRTERDGLGIDNVRFAQRYHGIPVAGRQVIVHLKDGAVVAANGDALAGIGLPTKPRITAAQATATARDAMARRAPRAPKDRPELVVFGDAARRAHLVWSVTTATARPLGLWRTYVDALDGKIVRAFDTLRYAKDRDVYHGNNDSDCNTDIAPACTLPGTFARGEGDAATGDEVLDDLYTFTGDAYDYFSTTFGRDSYDGAGHTIRSTAHFGDGFANAFWCPDGCADLYGSLVDGEQLVFGDGDGVLFSEIAQDADVVTHELSHGVTSDAVGFEPFDQSGALDEAYADLFAAFRSSNWEIGEGSFTPLTPGDALRDLSDPSAEGYPAHMDDYVKTFYDAGAVHSNSLIPAHAAYLTSEDPTTGALGEAATEQIYYRALTAYLTPSASFLDNLNALVASAIDLHGHGSPEVEAIVAGHAAVGIVNAATPEAPIGGATLKGGAATTVSWDADGTDGLGFDVSFGRPSGSSVYQQGFESSGLPSVFELSGDAEWTSTTTDFWTGARSVRAGNIDHGERSVLTLTRTLLAPGSIDFLGRVSSEESFDFFGFYIDGQAIGFGSGDPETWFLVSEPVDAGRHTFTWIYEKDEVGDEGLDTVFIDDLVITNSPSTTWTAIDTTVAGASSTPWTPPVTTGTDYRIRVETGSAAAGFGDSIAGPFTVDATKPTGVKVTSALAPFQVRGTKTAVNVTVPWTGTDAHSGIASFDVRWRFAGPNGSFSTYELLFERSTRLSQVLPVTGTDLRGLTMCFSVRARDAVGNVSAYSANRCSAVPIDNLQLGASAGWTSRTNQSGYYLKSYDQTTTKGAFLRAAPIKGKVFAVIATKCSGCGTIEVLRGTTVLRRVSLDASSLKKRQVIPIKTFGSIQPEKRITIRVVSSGKLVRIEGLGVSLG